MINLLIYHGLLVCCLASLFKGRSWVLYGFAFLGPMVEVLPSPYGFIVSPPNAILLGLLGMAYRVKRDDLPAHPPPNLRVLVLWTIVLFFGVMRTIYFPPAELFSRFVAMDLVRAGWYWTTPFVVYFIVYRIVTKREIARRIIMISMFSYLLECGLAVYERLQGVGRATAHLDEANRAGAYFAGTSVLFLAFVLITKGRTKKLAFGAWLLAEAALFATLSRGGMVAMALGSSIIFTLFVFFSPHKTMSQKLKYLILSVLLITNLALVLPARVQERLLFTFQGDSSKIGSMETLDAEEMDGSSAGRVTLWTAGMDLFRQQKSGYGAFTANPLQARYRGEGGKAMHNIYLQLLVEHGIQGLCCFLLLITVVGANHGRRFMMAGIDVEESSIFLGLLGFWIAFCVAHFFVNPFFMLQINGQFWLMSACALRFGPNPRAPG